MADSAAGPAELDEDDHYIMVAALQEAADRKQTKRGWFARRKMNRRRSYSVAVNPAAPPSLNPSTVYATAMRTPASVIQSLKADKAEDRGEGVAVFWCDPPVGQSVAEAMDRAKALPLLIALLGDSESVVRAKAAFAFGFLTEAERAGYVYDENFSEAEFLRIVQKDPSTSSGGLEDFTRLAEDSDPTVRVAVLLAAARLTQREREGELLAKGFRGLHDHSPLVLKAAARLVLAMTPSERATTSSSLPTALAVLSHDGDVASRALLARRFGVLGQAEREAHIGTYRLLLHDDDPRIRALAVLQVAGLSSAERQTLLQRVCSMAERDAEGAVREAAAAGLHQVSTEELRSHGIVPRIHTPPAAASPSAGEERASERRARPMLGAGEYTLLATAESPHDRARAAAIYGHLTPAERGQAEAEYTRLFYDESAVVVAAAAESFVLLSEATRDELALRMTELLDAEESEVRAAAAKAILTLTRDGWETLRLQAPRSLLILHPSSRTTLMDQLYTGLLHDADEGVRAAAVETFPRFAVTVRSPHIPAFSQRLTDSEPAASIRREAIGVVTTLTTLERTPCVGPLARMIVGDANTECRATAAAAFTALEPSERTAILGELAGAVLTNKAVDRGIVLEVFGRLPREEQLLHNPTLLKYVLGRRRYTGDSFERAVLRAGLTAWEVAAVAALHDLTPAPSSLSWSLWEGAARGCGGLLRLECPQPPPVHTPVSTTSTKSVKSVSDGGQASGRSRGRTLRGGPSRPVTARARGPLLKILRNAGQTIPTQFKERWIGLVQEGAREAHAILAPSLQRHAVQRGRTLRQGRDLGAMEAHAEWAGASDRFHEAAHPDQTSTMRALQAQYVRERLLIDVLPESLTRRYGELRAPVAASQLALAPGGAELTGGLNSGDGTLGHAQQTVNGPPQLRWQLILTGSGKRMVSKQEKLVDAILRAAPGSRVLSVTSNMAAPDPTSLLTTSVLLAVLLPRPPWAGIEVTQTACGLCAGGEATRQAPAEYMTFGDMRADPDWGRVVEETLQHKRLPARDVKTAEREFDKEGIRGTPVTAYLQLDMHLGTIFHQQEFLQDLITPQTPSAFFAKVTTLSVAELMAGSVPPTLGRHSRVSVGSPDVGTDAGQDTTTSTGVLISSV
eukprot:m.97298 g.97298  ORF g.97298 m.97298 type:complete len:1139 (-) comp12393_c0_seq1:105-3521(-)